MLTSLQNTKVKEWKKLHKRKYRNQTGLFLVEGFHLVEEVIKSDWEIEELIVREGTNYSVGGEVPVTKVSPAVFAAIAETETPQGIAAVVHQKEWKFQSGALTLMMDAVQDPGNVGTLIRTADAAGFDQVVLGSGTVDVFNDKVIRATQGSIFHIPFTSGDLNDFIEPLKENGAEIWASALQDAEPFQQLPSPDRAALIVGNEGKGIHEELLNQADQRVYIPIYGQAESLNVGIAGAVLMYHLKG
ncbi:RNA methyltransferase, TrmH family [Halobacillus dabanensis]|uniref:RNA methyltransferase, TrmH family n=1 Tax=Halobacillus dabanensis TaxID=240302 RepID=A0A1I3NY03_HALDA|nr:RNA methyltransferase [Halobacillus dabanensis]SFJ14047.1 RNA methyltransferase, TrmH family [Halobacillus dabanensis]